MTTLRIGGTRSRDARDTLGNSSIGTLTHHGFIVPQLVAVGDYSLYAKFESDGIYMLWQPYDADAQDIFSGDFVRKFKPRIGTAPTVQPPTTAPVKSAFDTQEGGSHYSSKPDGYQPFQISKALDLNPVEHTVLKYLLRHRDKNGKVDLLKAKHCLDILIEQEYPDALAP